MTGFGRAEGQVGDMTWVWEARSVNGRNLDIKHKLPPGHDGFEPRIREACTKRFKRGSLQVSLSVKRNTVNQNPSVRINLDMIDFYLAEGSALIAAGQVLPPRLDGLLHLRGVLEAADTCEAVEVKASRDAAILEGLEAALDQLLAERQREGDGLFDVFTQNFSRIDELIRQADTAAEAQVLAIRDRVHKRAVELLGEVPFDPQRLAQEAAALALKSDVREELDRLAAHLTSARTLLNHGGDIGRKLDFLAQEFHRESNTLTTKAATIALTNIGLELKALVDQLKEQAANVE
ncbi:YicC/YloC family endoribonuclease [Candidatus Phycosocius spiralis]|nr:YicC/YloC family endoribonuclease [Candidatus Phycosocius spiralis]